MERRPRWARTRGYHVELPVSVAAGNPLQLHVAIGAMTIAGVGNVPENPVITAPPSRRGVARDGPDRRDLEQRDGSRSVQDLGAMVLRPQLRNRQVVRRGRRVPYRHDSPADLPTGVDLQLSVMSYNDGSFTGPADSTSTMNIRGESSTASRQDQSER